MDGERESDEDDVPQLSEHAMAALMEFYTEQNVGDKAEQNSKVKENWVRILNILKYTANSQ